MPDEFDQNAYWIQRHEQYHGDPRSVGNMGKSLAENLKGESRLVSAVTWAANDLKPFETLLDVGCGYGRVASCFCDARYDYTGIDVAPTAIEAARNGEPRGHFILGSALEIEFEMRFDLVCAFYVFVHFVDEGNWLSLIKRLSSQLKEGGALLFADDLPEIERRPSRHVRLRPLSRYVSVLGAQGLTRDIGFKERLLGWFPLGGSPPPFELFRLQ